MMGSKEGRTDRKGDSVGLEDGGLGYTGHLYMWRRGVDIQVQGIIKKG